MGFFSFSSPFVQIRSSYLKKKSFLFLLPFAHFLSLSLVSNEKNYHQKRSYQNQEAVNNSFLSFFLLASVMIGTFSLLFAISPPL